MPKATIPPKNHRTEFTGVILVAVGCLTALALVTAPDAVFGDGPIRTGIVGGGIVRLLTTLVGKGKYILPLVLIWLGFSLIRGRRDGIITDRGLAFGTLFIMLLAGWHFGIGSTTPAESLARGVAGEGGGAVGALISIILYAAFGLPGSYVVIVAIGVIAFLIMTNLSLAELIRKLFIVSRKWYVKLKGELVSFLFTTIDEETGAGSKAAAPEESGPVIVHHAEHAVESGRKVREVQDRSTMVPQTPPETRRRKDGQAKEGDTEKGKETLASVRPLGDGPQLANYALPPLALLAYPPKIRGLRGSKDIAEKVKVLEETLESFGVKGKVTQVSLGPAITRFELQPAPGVKVSRIVNLADDIALSMAAADVRIEAPIPGKAAVGIEVPNKEVAVVSLREVLETNEFIQSNSKLTIALGKDIAGQPVVADLEKMPHLLVAGATGSGKSVCINALVSSLLFKCTPFELKLLMIDPKMVELTNYNGIPHLIAPVVTEPKKAATALRWVVSEMENRYELFAGSGVRDIIRYNALKQREQQGPVPAMPYIVVVIDELADLMMVAPADVEDAICRLAQMARAAGIHLVVATQRPSVDVITGLIKANIPSRIAFAVSSQVDSRTILDMGGAEKLLGRGDMLFFPVGAAKPLRVQGVFVSDREVDELVSFLRTQGNPEYVSGVAVEREGQQDEPELEDDLLPEAVRLMIESGQASISMLQRRLHIGYTRAARLMDMMEQRGIVGGYEGSKPRNVLVNWDDYKRMFS